MIHARQAQPATFVSDAILNLQVACLHRDSDAETVEGQNSRPGDLRECPDCGLLQDPKDTCQNENCMVDMRNIKSPTAGLRFHDLRHHAITELAESQASDQTIMAIAGHVSPRMLNHYSHVRLAAKRNALDALSDSFSKGSTPNGGTSEPNEDEGSYDTSRDATLQCEKGASAETIGNYGRPEWTRTIDLFRVKEAL